MVDPREIERRIKRRMGRVLDLAEAMLPAEQFRIFRRLFLKEFGDRELQQELRELFGLGRR